VGCAVGAAAAVAAAAAAAAVTHANTTVHMQASRCEWRLDVVWWFGRGPTPRCCSCCAMRGAALRHSQCWRQVLGPSLRRNPFWRGQSQWRWLSRALLVLRHNKSRRRWCTVPAPPRGVSINSPVNTLQTLGPAAACGRMCACQTTRSSSHVVVKRKMGQWVSGHAHCPAAYQSVECVSLHRPWCATRGRRGRFVHRAVSMSTRLPMLWFTRHGTNCEHAGRRRTARSDRRRRVRRQPPGCRTARSQRRNNTNSYANAHWRVLALKY
jgi:hypothetical protein